MKITLITPCRNAAARLPATLESVLGQDALRDGTVELEYWIIDGASTDGSAEIAAGLGGARVRVLSEADGGMYDALCKGLERATGEVVGYLNAGDRLLPGALAALAGLFADPEVRWLSGIQSLGNAAGQVVWVREPYRFRAGLIRRGVYGRWLPFIQQESTFWRRDLLAAVDRERLRGLRLAGDYFLWYSFARLCEPVCANVQLGVFTVHPGQLSEDRRGYAAEIRSFAGRPGPLSALLAALDAPCWFLPKPLKRLLNPALRFYDHGRGTWGRARAAAAGADGPHP